MTCQQIGGAIVCGPPAGVYHRAYLWCGECDRRHGFIVRWDGAWYGSTFYGSCGDRWQDGEMSTRPFERGWRKAAKAAFAAMWQNATTVALYDAYVRADRRFATDDDWEAAESARQAALDAIRAHRASAA